MAKRAFMLFVPEQTATIPAGGRCITDSWWLVHPGRGLAFYEWGGEEPSPQCNTDRRVVDMTLRTTGSDGTYAGHVAKFFPVVFTAHARRELKRLREQDIRTLTSSSEGGDG